MLYPHLIECSTYTLFQLLLLSHRHLTAYNYMHGEHVVLTVDRPGVKVFRPAHTLQRSNSLGCRRQVKFLGTPLQNDAEALPHVAIDIEQDEKRDRHRKQ